MVVKYTNRKGVDYFLCQGMTKLGKAHYYFSRETQEDSPDEIPEGYQIVESVNGKVSLAKERPQIIFPEELAIVEKAVGKHPRAEEYRVDTKGKTILVYEREGPSLEGLVSIFGEISPLPADEVNRILQEKIVNTFRFSPVLRFTLEDKKERAFSVARWVYLGSFDDWGETGLSGGLPEMTSKVIPLLGSEDFFDLI